MSKIISLVTGGAGFIGAHVVNALLESGCKSVTDYRLLARIFSRYKIDYVYHLAAYAAEGLSHFIKRFNYTNNLIGSVNLINESVKHKVKCFVFTSSIAVYGANQLPMHEDMPPQPEDSYGIAKYAVEEELKATRHMV